ncbi:MAG: hypothetical protein ABJ327_22425 [Litoreibacter sp.]
MLKIARKIAYRKSIGKWSQWVGLNIGLAMREERVTGSKQAALTIPKQVILAKNVTAEFSNF